MKYPRIPLSAVALLFLSLASTALAQTETVLYDGWETAYSNGTNRTPNASGEDRPGSLPDGDYVRFVDGDASTAGDQSFALGQPIAGMPAAYTGPTLYGGAAWVDTARTDDTSGRAGTVISVRNAANDVRNAGGDRADSIRSYVLSDSSGISPDEGIGLILFDYAGGAGLSGLSWTGSKNTDDLTAILRWVVVDGSGVYVSNQTVTINDNGTGTQTDSLADVSATTWALWDPSVEALALKFSSTSPSFAPRTFGEVTQVGYLWEIEDSVSASNYIDTARFTATAQAVAPVITSAATAEGNVALPFSYQIVATDDPSSFGLSGTLPDGLSFDTNTGEISGTPTTEEVQTVILSASNAQGTGNASLEITIGPELSLPEITSPASVLLSAGADFAYQITASNDPTGYTATGLPAGLEIDPVNGVITGTAMEAGTFEVTLTALNNAGSSQDFDLTLDIGAFERDEIPGGRTFRCYFLGNSLTLSLTTAPQPHLARLERIFAESGNRLIFGATLGAGVNLDQHWSGKLYSPVGNENWMKQTYFDDQHEHSVDNGWAGPGVDFGSVMFRDYNFALQGKRRDLDGTIVDGHVFDALIMQSYIGHLDAENYTATEQANGAIGARAAINNFISYASAGNPSGFDAVKRFYIYSVWPQLLGIEQAAIDTDGNGVYSFSEFYDSAYTPPVNPTTFSNSRTDLPKRDFAVQLHDAARNDHPAEADRIFLIPVGEVMAELDRLIRSGALNGIEAYYNRNKAYYTAARAGEGIPFEFIYPPNEPENFGNDFIAAQGIKNIYADNIHWNDQTHNDPDSGTIGAYVAAATIHSVITGEPPNRLSAADVARHYESFDPVADAALITQLQDTIWQIVTSPNWKGVDYAERTGLGQRSETARSYRDFAAAYFTPAELSDPLVSGESAESAIPGLTNIEAYFAQVDPTAPGIGLPIGIEVKGSLATLSFDALSRPTGLVPALEVSDDLVGWERLPPGAFSTRPTGTAGLDRYTVSVDADAAKGFQRVALPFAPDRPTLPLVAWGDSAAMVSSNQNLVNGLGATTLDLSTPAVGSGYSTFSPVFYAAGAATGAGNSFDILRLNEHSNPEDGTGDVLLTKWTASNGLDNDGVFTMLWTQDGDGGTGGFLNGAGTGNVRLASLDLSAKVGFGSGSVSQLRFVIRIGGDFYISEDRGAITSVRLAGANDSPYERIRLPNPHGVEWYTYDPEADPMAIGAPVAIESFSGITAVGFNWRTAGDENIRNLYIESFRADFYPEL